MKFKSGDKVRVLGKTIGQSLNSFYTDSKTRKGIILIINKAEQKLLNNQCCVFIWFLNITGGYYFMASDLELVSEPKEEQMVEECQFKYGDIVEVKYRNGDIWHKAKFMVYDKDAKTSPSNALYIVRKFYSTGNKEWLESVSAWDYCRKYVEPKPDLAMDTPIWVSNDNKNWTPRHFHSWDKDIIKVFDMGCTSHTNWLKNQSSWKYWSLTDPTKGDK